MPKINFGQHGKEHKKYYTRYFEEKDNTVELSNYCLTNYKRWEEEIEKWQEPILSDSKLPEWYKSALFNETYFVSDGGTVWLETTEEEKNRYSSDDPRFGLQRIILVKFQAVERPVINHYYPFFCNNTA